DQGLFVERALFEERGGFPEIELMEDVAMSSRLRKSGAPLCLSAILLASSRRWESNGIWRTIVLMWRLRLAYFLGSEPHRLAELYNGRKK
ncbi:MAG: glycosyl transferase, partial [Betaproteobacteria bacterium]